MSHDAINSWVEKAKEAGASAATTGNSDDEQIVCRVTSSSKGGLIMAVAERIRPWLMTLFENVRDENGMLVQPARVRGIALNVAQDIVNNQKA